MTTGPYPGEAQNTPSLPTRPDHLLSQTDPSQRDSGNLAILAEGGRIGRLSQVKGHSEAAQHAAQVEEALPADEYTERGEPDYAIVTGSPGLSRSIGFNTTPLCDG